MPETLALDQLREAVAGAAAAFRCITEYQPAGGAGDKVFPPTYEGGRYATEDRIIDGQQVPCVLLDSVQSQANRLELALLEARRAGRIDLPLITVRFDQAVLKRKFTVTSLEAPHRIADAILRDSLYDGIIFRRSDKGRVLDTADARNATGLFGLCPTALVFGLWDSTGPRGGLGTKFQRAIVSEIIGINAIAGKRTSSRIDSASISSNAGPLYERAEATDNAPDWTVDLTLAKLDTKQQAVLYNRNKNDRGKPGNPSKANHSNVLPTIADGGFTLSRALQTTVLSLTALRRLRFPLNDAADSTPAVDVAARTVLAALGLCGAVLAREEGADLRSRCQLFPTQAFVWELLDTPGKAYNPYVLSSEDALKLFTAALAEAKAAGLPWEDEIQLTPSPDLVKLVAKSQELAMHQAEAEGG